MPAPGPLTPRRLPDPVRRRLDIATAMAWEALAEAHAAHALQFIALLSDRLPFEEGVDRYLKEMYVADPMATAIRTRVLVALEDAYRQDQSRPSFPFARPPEAPADAEDVEGWRRFRPDVVMRGVKERYRRNEETEQWIQLAIARAEEGVLGTHVDNAITFAALLEDHMPLDRAVAEYINTMGLAGARAQAVLQRTMARLADAHLPLLERGTEADSTSESPADS